MCFSNSGYPLLWVNDVLHFPSVKHFSDLTNFLFSRTQSCTTFVLCLFAIFSISFQCFQEQQKTYFLFENRQEKGKSRLRPMPPGNFYSRAINPFKQAYHGHTSEQHRSTVCCICIETVFVYLNANICASNT